jgi:hypothetical protein
MRNVILNIAVILSGITLLGSTVCALLYDFEDENQFSDWNVIQGNWSIIDGELDGKGPQVGQPGVMIVLSDDIWNDEWKDYTVEFRARILEDTEDAGVVFRWQKAEPDDRRYYLYRIDNWPREFNQKQAEGWIAGDMQGQTRVEIESDLWYRFRLVVAGDKFNCYLDDELMFELQDPQQTYSWGRVGFRMWNSHARYDDLNITGPGIPNAAVESDGKLAATWGGIKTSGRMQAVAHD